MPRSVRIEYPGAVYHVMCRGDRREVIFENDKDRTMFLETLGEACDRTGFRIHSYVLMPNHYHLLLETPEANLVAGMKWFQGTYSQRFNAAHGLSGHVFQGRYKAVPVEAADPGYFRLVSDYIHLNPARAGRLSEGGELTGYAWSSFPAFVARSRLAWPWLVRRRVFESHDLPDEGRASRRRMAAYMRHRVEDLRHPEAAGEREASWNALRRGWYCGSEAFRDQLMDRVDGIVRGKRRSSYRAEGMRRHDEAEAERLLKDAVKRLGVGVKQLQGRKQSDAVKQAMAWWIKSRTVVGDEWICHRLEMGNRMNVYRAVRRYRAAGDAASRRMRQLLLCAD